LEREGGNTMKKTAVFILMGIFCLGSSVVADVPKEKESRTISVHLVPLEKEFNNGAPIRLKLNILNSGKKDIYIVDQLNRIGEYVIASIYDGTERQVAVSTDSKVLLPSAGVKLMTGAEKSFLSKNAPRILLKAGSTLEKRYDIVKIYDRNAPDLPAYIGRQIAPPPDKYRIIFLGNVFYAFSVDTQDIMSEDFSTGDVLVEVIPAKPGSLNVSPLQMLESDLETTPVRIPPPSTYEPVKFPKAALPEPVFDFGKIKQGEKVHHVFKIKNTGEATLEINNVTTSCGCTAASILKKRLEPGEEVPIEVNFDSTSRIGEQSKDINIYTNDPSNPTSRLILKGDVE